MRLKKIYRKADRELPIESEKQFWIRQGHRGRPGLFHNLPQLYLLWAKLGYSS